MIEDLIHLDQQAFLFFNSGIQNGLMDLLCPFIRSQSNWYPAYAVMLYLVFKHYKKNFWKLLLWIGITILVADQTSSGLIKHTVERLRPCNDPVIGPQVRLLAHCGQGFSFTSSHATNHFAVAVLLGSMFGSMRKWIWPALLLWAASIGFSQVYVGVHYPLDVICGSVLGASIGTLSVYLIRRYTLLLNREESVH